MESSNKNTASNKKNNAGNNKLVIKDQKYWQNRFNIETINNYFLFCRKNKEYDSAFVALGVEGIFTQLWGDAHKLKTVIKNKGVTEEKLEDIFRDMAIFGTMGIMLLKDEKFGGK